MYFVDIHTHRRTSPPDTLCLYSGRFPESGPPPSVLYWAGIHPWDAGSAGGETFAALEALGAPGLAGIGEIGLDFSRREVDSARQREVFVRQLDLAVRRRLPVCLHVVRAHNEVLSLLKNYAGRLPAVIVHGFVGSPQLARSYLDLGACLSFGFGTFASPRTAEALKAVPADRLFLETDTDPRPVGEVYEAASELRGMPPALLRERLYTNYTHLFAKDGKLA